MSTQTHPFKYSPNVTLIFPSKLWEYLVATTLIILAPGPSVLFTIARAVAWGRMVAIATVLGNVLGEFVISILVALGLGPVLQRYHFAFIAVQWLGALYLIFLGIDALRHIKDHAEKMTDISAGRPSLPKTIKEGFIVGLLNPKTLVFFIAILPEFVDRPKGHLISQLLLLGSLFCLIALISDGTWGIIAGTLRGWLSSTPTRLERLRMMGGTVMVGLGLFTFINSLLNG